MDVELTWCGSGGGTSAHIRLDSMDREAAVGLVRADTTLCGRPATMSRVTVGGRAVMPVSGRPCYWCRTVARSQGLQLPEDLPRG